MKKDKKGSKVGLLMALSIVLILVSISMIVISSNKKVKKTENILSYSEISNTNYKVYLKDDSSSSNKIMNKGLRYNSEEIDKIVTDLDYSFLADDRLDIDYKYDIYVLMKKDDETINTYSLVSDKEDSVKKTTGFKINEVIDIDYNTYRDSVIKKDDFATDDYVLDLVFKVYINSSVKEEKVKTQSETLLSIPLNKIDFKIDEYNVKNTESIKGDVDYSIKNKDMIMCATVVGGIAILLFVISLLILIIKPSNRVSYKSEYKKVRRMVKDYDELIKRTYKMPSLKGKKITELKLIDEFMAIQDKYELNMTMVEKEDSVVFVLVTDSKAWMYSIDKLEN